MEKSVYGFDMYRVVNASNVPPPAVLLDQVLAAATGCAGNGARLEFAWQPKPHIVALQKSAYGASIKAAREAADADADRRRANGETVARRDKSFDDVTPTPNPSYKYKVLPQVWKPVPRLPPSSPWDRNGDGKIEEVSDLPEPLVQLTHQVVTRASVHFKARGPMNEREAGTGSFSHQLDVVFETPIDECAFAVTYLLNESLVHDMQNGPLRQREDAKLRKARDRHALNLDTWFKDIPFVLSIMGHEYEPFSKTFDIDFPGDCDAVISNDFIVLRQALHLHDWQNPAMHANFVPRDPQVFATSTFYGGVTTERDDAHECELRWVQLTPFTSDAWRADDAGGKLKKVFDLTG